MIHKNAVGCLAALIAIFLAVGLVEYAQLDGAGTHSQLSFDTHTPSIVGASAVPTSHPTNDPPPASGLAGALPVTATPRTKHTSPLSARPRDPVRHAATVSHGAVGLVYVVQTGDTLWQLAAAHLGNSALWTELFALNHGRHEPDGRAFVDPNRIYTGWTIEFPAGATGLHLAASTEPAASLVARGNPATQTLALGAPAKDSSQ